MALDHIPAKLSVVLVLHFFDGFDAIEVGELLLIPEGTAHSRIRSGGAVTRYYRSDST